MLNWLNKDKRTNLEKEIDNVIGNLNQMDPASDEYKSTADNLERLYKSKSYERERRIDPNTVLTVCGSLAGILLILNYEKLDVLTSKAVGFVIKGRV